MPPPIRIQRKRVAGWRMPANTVYVGRGSGFGNPYPISDYAYAGDDAAKFAVAAYANSLTDQMAKNPELRNAVMDLKGKNLCCWCPAGNPCHADILLQVSNGNAEKC